MKRKTLFQALLLCVCCFTSCVDSKYDLADVDTDDIVVGGTWVAPLGSGTISMKDVVNTDKVASIDTLEDGSYIARYAGTMKKDIRNGLRAGTNLVEVANEVVNTSDLHGLFEGEFVLGLADPHIELNTGLVSGWVDARLGLTTENATEKKATFADFPVAADHPNIWIGASEAAVAPGYLFVKNDSLSKLIQIVPDQLVMSFMVDPDQAETMPDNSFDNIGYLVELPLAPNKAFRATAVERINDAFDESIVSYLFKGGSAKIYGDVQNELPMDVSIEMKILDEMDKPLDINFKVQPITGSEGKVEFIIPEADMPKMQDARHIELNMHLKGREQPSSLNSNQKITLKLNITKEGGISI